MNTSSNGSSNKNVFILPLCSQLLLNEKHSYRRVTEDTMYTDQQVRGLKKAMFRRLTSKLNIHKALDSKDDAKSALVELKKAFTAFEEAHDVVCAPITDFGVQLKEEQEFIDVWLYGTNCDVS